MKDFLNVYRIIYEERLKMNKKDEKEKRSQGTFVRLTQDELDMMRELKTKYHVNISSMIRGFIREYYDKMKDEKCV